MIFCHTTIYRGLHRTYVGPETSPTMHVCVVLGVCLAPIKGMKGTNFQALNQSLIGITSLYITKDR